MTSTDRFTTHESRVIGEPRTRTQTDQVLDYLRNIGPLDQFTAKDELGVLRLGARVWDLKQRGYAIRTELIEAPTEYGGTRIAQYSLLRERVRDGRPAEDDAARATAPGEPRAPSEADPTAEAVSSGAPASEPRTLDDAYLASDPPKIKLTATRGGQTEVSYHENESALFLEPPRRATRWVLDLSRECDGFFEWHPGFSPQEHREMLDRRWQEERQERRDSEMREREDRRDGEARIHEDRRDAVAKEREDRRDAEADRRHWRELWVMGGIVTAAVSVATMIAAVVEGAISRGWEPSWWWL